MTNGIWKGIRNPRKSRTGPTRQEERQMGHLAEDQQRGDVRRQADQERRQ